MILLAMIWACDNEPVLVGVVPETPEATRGRSEPEVYERAEGVQVDCSWLAGRPWDAARADVLKQLGDIMEIEDLGENGRKIVLERGEIREFEGTVYQVRFDLDTPTRRAGALVAAGIPQQVDRWYSTHREWLVRWTWGFARLRFGKAVDDPETVLWVECTRWFPKDDRRR